MLQPQRIGVRIVAAGPGSRCRDKMLRTKRQHEPPRIVRDLLSAEIAEKQARSIKYQLTIAKLPLAKDIEDFDFTGTRHRPSRSA